MSLEFFQFVRYVAVLRRLVFANAFQKKSIIYVIIFVKIFYNVMLIISDGALMVKSFEQLSKSNQHVMFLCYKIL